MNVSYATPAIQKATLLLVLLFIFTFSNAQNLTPYQIDTTFKKTINALLEEGKYHTSCVLLEKRIYETAQDKAFFDFDYALLNYFRAFNKAGYSNQEKENILHRMYDILPQLDAAYAYVLGSYIRNRFDNTSLFSMYAESKEWKLKGETIKLEELADLKRIQNEIAEIAQKGLVSLIKYQHPHLYSKNYTYLDQFFAFGNGIESFSDAYQLLYKYHQKYKHNYELIQLDIAAIHARNYGSLKQEKWNAFDSLYRLYAAVPESEWILSELYSMTKEYQKKCALKLDLIPLLAAYTARFDSKQGSHVAVIYHQLINPEFSVEFNETGLNTQASTFSIKARNVDTLYYNIYSYKDAFTSSASKKTRLEKDKMKLISSRILRFDKNEVCFTEKYFLQEKLAENDNYIFVWTDDSTFFDSLTGNLDSLSGFNFQLRTHTFDKFIAHEVLEDYDDVIHLLLRDKALNLAEGVEVYAFGTKEVRKDGKKIKKNVHQYLGKTDQNGILSSKLDFDIDTLKFVQDGKVQIERYRNSSYPNYDDFEKTPLFEKIAYSFAGEDRFDFTEFIIHTDRTKYKPGQTVYFKAIAFLLDDYENLYKLIKTQPFKIEVKDPSEKIIYTTELKLSQWGSLSGEFKLPENAVLGTFTIEINEWSQFEFSVEEYKEKRAKISTAKIEKLYVLGDSIRITGNVLTNTNIGIQNALITLYKKNEVISTTQTDAQGAFFFDIVLDTSDKNGYQRFNLKAILGSGEVLEDSKTISIQSSKYKMLFYRNPTSDFLYVQTFNHDDHLIPFEGIQYKVKQFAKSSSFFNFPAGFTDFTQEEYERLLPNYFTFKNIEKVEIHQLLVDSLNIKEFLKVFEDKRFELEFFYLNENADTIVIKEYKIKEALEYDYLPFTIDALGNIKSQIQTTKTYLVLYQKNQLIVKTQRLNKAEIEALKGTNLLHKYESIAIVDYSKRFLNSTRFSRKRQLNEILKINPLEMDSNLHPGEEYAYTFEVLNKKGKRLKNVELLAYMCKSEFFNYHNNTYFDFLEDVIYREDSWSYIQNPHSFRVETPGSSYINSEKGYSERRKKINLKLVRTDAEQTVYSSPLIMRDGGATGRTITREDIAKLPVRSAAGIASTVSGVNEIFDISVRGSRSDGVYYYIDGIKVRGNSNLPKSALNEVEEVMFVAYRIPENTDFRRDELRNYQIPRKRSNFDETVFFQPEIRSNSKGIYTVKFKQKDDLNRYSFYLFGHTKKLKTGEFKSYLDATLPVNIQVNKPRFIRERDEVVFKNALYNQTKDTLVGKVDFFLTAKADSALLNKTFKTELSQEVTIPPFSMKTIDWKLIVPENSPSELTFLFQLLSNVGSDIYTDDLTVLNNRMENAASLPFFKLNSKTQDFAFEELDQIPASAILKEAFVYLDEENTWNAFKKFAEVMTKDYQVTNYQVAQLYAALMFKYLLESQPGLLKTLANHVVKIKQDKSKLLLTENPYGDFKGYGNNEALILFMQQLTDTTFQQEFISKRIEELKLAQNSDGGFPWYKGGSSSVFITNYVFTTLNRLTQHHIHSDFDFKEKTGKYLDRFYEKNWNKSTLIGPSFEAQILWLMNKGSVDEATEKEMHHFEKELFANWQGKDVYSISLIGQLALKRERIEVARKIRASLLDISKMTNKRGRIFDGLHTNDQGKSIAATIRFLEKMDPNDEEIKNFGIGLRAQQAYTNNTSYLSALDYWDALLISHKKEELMQGTVVIRLGNKEEITFTQSSDKVRNVPLEKLENLHQIQLESKPEDLVTGGAIVTYEDDIENMFKSTSDELRIQRIIFLKEKGEYRRLKEGESLPLGSEIQIEINIINQAEMEYMHLIIPKATGMELSAERSGYYWTQGFSYYVQLKNAVVDIFLERIPKGKSRIFFSAYLTSEGKLTMAPTTIQSFEHPALKASDATFKITVH